MPNEDQVDGLLRHGQVHAGDAGNGNREDAADFGAPTLITLSWFIIVTIGCEGSEVVIQILLGFNLSQS